MRNLQKEKEVHPDQQYFCEKCGAENYGYAYWCISCSTWPPIKQSGAREYELICEENKKKSNNCCIERPKLDNKRRIIMLDYQKRVVNEKRELDEKLELLVEFLNSPMFEGIKADEVTRLGTQLSIMRDYSNILEERIEAFE